MNDTTLRIYLLAAIILALAGMGAIISSGFVDTVALRVGLELGGVGFLALGLLSYRLGQAEARAEERHKELLAKLDEVNEGLKKLEEKPQNSGAAIADVLGVGMKWYQDYLDRGKEQKEDNGPEA